MAEKKAMMRHMIITPMDNGGHVVEVHMKSKPSKSGAFHEMEEPKKDAFGNEQHGQMMAHIAKHLGVEHEAMEEEPGAEEM